MVRHVFDSSNDERLARSLHSLVDECQANTQAASKGAESAYQVKPLHVLLIESYAGSQNDLAEQLKELGHTVKTTDRLVEALREIQTKRHQAVFVDSQFNHQDAFSTAQLIRQFERETDSRIPVLSVSKPVTKTIEELGKQYGMTGFINKEVDLEVLQESLYRFTA